VKWRDILRTLSTAIFRFRYTRFHLVRVSRMSHNMRTCCHGGVFSIASNALHISLLNALIFLFTFVRADVASVAMTFKQKCLNRSLTHTRIYIRVAFRAFCYIHEQKTIVRHPPLHQWNNVQTMQIANYANYRFSYRIWPFLTAAYYTKRVLPSYKLVPLSRLSSSFILVTKRETKWLELHKRSNV